MVGARCSEEEPFEESDKKFEEDGRAVGQRLKMYIFTLPGVWLGQTYIIFLTGVDPFK